MVRKATISLDEVCKRLADGESMTAIAAGVGVSTGSLSEWLEATVERSARSKEARRLAARHWDEKAEQVIRDAARHPVELTRARELAHHYRWRAKMTAPRDYGDKVDHTVSGPAGGPVQVTVTRVVLDGKES